MMLNNSGQSLIKVIILCLFMFICLLISGYYCYILFGAVNEEEGNDYIKLETLLTKATMKYNKKYGYNDGVIGINILEKLGYIDNFKDIYGNKCEGYVEIENYLYKPYVKCPKYTTNGYGE